MAIYRKNAKSKSGWDNGDIDVAFQLFSCGMVWDGNLVSKDSRDHLVNNGYAVRANGFQSLTGKGSIHFLCHFRTWVSAFRRFRLWKSTGLVADSARIKRAMN